MLVHCVRNFSDTQNMLQVDNKINDNLHDTH